MKIVQTDYQRSDIFSTDETFFERKKYMTPEKIIAIIEGYEQRLSEAKVHKVRMDTKRTFASLTKKERLAHAHFLCAGVKQYATDPHKQRKAGSHLTAVQMCLSFAGWYTLEDLMNHNRPDQKETS